MFENSEPTNTKNDLLWKISDCAENIPYIPNQYISVENFKKFLPKTGLLKNNYSVHNSQEFVDLVKNCVLGENEVLVSFDVISLFTSVLVDKALDLILELLSSDDSLPSRTSLDISDLKHGLENSLYKQTFGTSIGSCISPVIAYIYYMEHITKLSHFTLHHLHFGWDM